MTDNRFYELVSHLWRGGSYSYFWTPDTDEGKLSFWFPTVKPKEISPLWQRINIYFGVHPARVQGGMRSRAKLEDIEAVNCLFAEFDLADGQSKTHLLECINQLDTPPSVIVFSGGGYHCYWLLEQTYHIDSDEARQRIIDIQYSWVDFVGSDQAAKDIARLLRVPGTYNRKPEYAPNYPQVEIIKFNLDLLYSLDDFTVQTELLIQQIRQRRADMVGADVVPVDLDDQTILEKMQQKDSAALALWDGDISAYNNDHSDADLALCSKLAFWFGRDKERIDRVFRRSGLYRTKWLRDDYRQRTIERAIASCTNTYTPPNGNLGNPQDLVKPAAHSNGNGAHSTVSTQAQAQPQQTQTGQGTVQTKQPKTPKQQTLSDDYIKKLEGLGYKFSLNELDDTVEVNGKRMDDVLGAEIRTRMRDIGFNGMKPVEDAYLAYAGQNRYHAVKDYLNSLVWDGNDYISLLSAMIKDDHQPIIYPDGQSKSVFHVSLKRWLIGSIAKVFGDNQNFMLVIDAAQGLGKSTFAKWLGSGIDSFFIESAIKTDDKEHDRYLATKWIWEVAELGATTRRQDVEALKSFLTKHDVTFRVPWGRHAIVKPALASFIGTINNENGFLTDITGNRRFSVVHVTSLDWSYQHISIHQLWAQALHLWKSGESSTLLPEEVVSRDKINEEYQIEDPYESWILKHYDVNPSQLGWKTTTQEIADFLQAKGIRGETRAIQMQISKTLKTLGLKQDANARPRVWKGIMIKSTPLNIP